MGRAMMIGAGKNITISPAGSAPFMVRVTHERFAKSLLLAAPLLLGQIASYFLSEPS